MFFCEVNFAARWFCLAALTMLGLPAVAQQAIQFSQPVDGDSSSKANPLRPEATRRDPATFNAPAPLFAAKPGASFDRLPGSSQQIFYNANQQQQWQKLLNDKKNWMLMTPEQVLGIPTPEKILGITDPNDDPNLSTEERFLKRRDQQLSFAATNGLRRMDSPLWPKDNTSGGLFQAADQQTPFAKAMTASVPEANRNFNSIFVSHPDQPGNADERFNSAWASPFNTPEAPPKPTPDQLAAMERFRALMAPPPEDKKPQSSGFFGLPAAAPDPNMEPVPTSFNPNGRSFAPLENNMGRPTGLTPLNGVTGPLPQPKKVAPLVQPPPWMQGSLQSPSLPQRQF